MEIFVHYTLKRIYFNPLSMFYKNKLYIFFPCENRSMCPTHIISMGPTQIICNRSLHLADYKLFPQHTNYRYLSYPIPNLEIPF